MQNRGLIDVAKQISLHHKMATIAHNLANVDKTAFKSRLISLKSESEQGGRGGPEGIAFAEVKGSHYNFTQGALKQTYNPLDLALRGPGFFKVKTPDNDAYTRDGQFTLNNLGQIVNSSNYPVLDGGGAAITIPPEAQQIKITAVGDVIVDGVLVGQIGITEFAAADLQKLKDQGEGLYISNIPGKPALETTIVQGTLEASNTSPIMELTNLIATHRAYDQIYRDAENEDERIQKSIDILGKTAS